METFNQFLDDMVSIIMPAYNSDNTISDSIESVLKQTYENWELIIIDDCSTDNTINVVLSFDDERICLIRQNSNRGVAEARNIGIKKARGRFLAFLDSDDVWSEIKIERQMSFMKTNDVSFSYTWYHHLDTENNGKIKVIKTQPYVNYQKLLKGNDIGCLTVMIDHAAYPNIMMPNKRHEDYITWLNILKENNGYAYSINEDLAAYRKSLNSLSSNKIKSIKWTWDVYRKDQNLSFFSSLYYLAFYAIRAIQKHIK
ncbi:MAG: glycosyltransferase family 2 protein [Selenomonas ruminantium]|jgi:teichuronic acid biosynthesis glycosyltransferase TuaG|nr:glycosyltransferase family 2 protein [Selenomonas ruminantium]